MDGRGINLDWERLIDGGDEDDDEPPQLEVVPNTPRSSSGEEMDVEESNELRSVPDKLLCDTYERMKNSYGVIIPRLKDGGEKLKKSLLKHEAELKRRGLFPGQENVDHGCKKALELQKQNRIGVSNDVLHRASSTPSSGQSTFASHFRSKLLEEKQTGSTAGTAFGKELSTLNQRSGLKMPSENQFIPSGRKNRLMSSRKSPFRSPGDPSPPTVSDEDTPSLFGSRKAAPQGRTSNSFKRTKGETVVLVDEEELEAEEATLEDNETPECFSKMTSIYYPSRDDPGSIEIRYSDMDCLAPEAYLSSTIMNFYIRYLEQQQQRQTLKAAVEQRHNYHFFNTYFYEKLKEAVAKKNMHENSFSKLRRWWKGVNIFEKAYIFLPIHENLHWSLVIVCIPNKEDRSGPILLHLDSLGFHCSSSIFSNIKSFLKEEWKFLNEQVLLDLPIAENVWKNLPRRIDEQIIEVPQQRNDSDCGLFVLFFMKRFIKDAPQRLKKKNLPKFGKKWFDPSDASNLRKTIRVLLKGMFKNASEEENQVSD